MTTLTLITTALLLFAALGYRIGGSGEVVKSGLLLVNSKPVSAQVFINGEDRQDRTDSRFVLPAGSYDIRLEAEGYRDWSHSLKLAASTVENFYYPLLIPEKLIAEPVRNLSTPQLVSQSPNKKTVLLYSQPSGVLQAIGLDPESPKLTTLTLPANFVKAGESYGQLTVEEWSSDSEHVLVKQRVNNSDRWLVVDVQSPGNSVDITARVDGAKLSNLYFARNNGSSVYARRGSSVVIVNLANGETSTLLTRVEQYKPYGQDMLSFVRTGVDGKEVQAGVWRDDNVTIVHTATSSKNSSGVSAFTSYNGQDYLATQLGEEDEVTLYRNPLQEPVLSKQLPYSSLSLAQADSITISPNGQFVLAQAGLKLAVYDLEHDRQRTFTAPKGTMEIDWVDSHHLQLKAADMNYISDFDGTNRYKLVGSDFGQLLFADDYESVYRIQKTKTAAELQNMSLLIQN